jgi:hypothetical protein
MTARTSFVVTISLLFAAGKINATQIRTVADLKADLGLAQRQVMPADLGLQDKEVLTAQLFDAPLVKGQCPFDEKMLMMAIEGMINRHGPLVFLDLSPSGWRGDATWLKYYADTHGFRFVGQDQDLSTFLKRTAPVFSGIVLYEPIPSDNYWLAMNLASLNFCLPVSRRIYDAHRECFRTLPIVVELPRNALSRTEIYDWLIREILPKTDLTAAYTPAADFPDLKLNLPWEELALSIDYPFYRRLFMFNISSLPAKIKTFPGSDGSPDMARQYDQIMRALTPPAAIFGWCVSEAEFCKYGHIQCCSATAPNLSFHAVVKPLEPPPYRQDLRSRIEKPEKKIYLSFCANEGDTLIVLTQLYYGDSWLDPGRGKVPLNWPINPYFAKLFPSLVEYYFRTKTDKDYFLCGPSGAGYVHPDAMKKVDLDRYIAFTGKWMREGATTREIILWEGRDPAVQKAYADGIPELRGLTVKPEQIYPWGEMLVAGDRNVPVLREPCATQYWLINPRFITHHNYADPEKVAQFRTVLKVNLDEFLKYLNELDQHVEKPYCLMAYGLQVNLPSEIARIQDALDKSRFEIVDMGTLCHLAGQEAQRIAQDAADALDPKQYPAMGPQPPGAVDWRPELLQDAARWQPAGAATVSGSKLGLRLQIPAGCESAAVGLAGVMLPPSATRVRIRVSEITGCRWVLEMDGEFDNEPVEAINIEGRREQRLRAAWQPFSEWSPHRRFPESDDRPLDKRFISNARQQRPVTLWLKVLGSEGGYAVFESLDFVDEAAARREQ